VAPVEAISSEQAATADLTEKGRRRPFRAFDRLNHFTAPVNCFMKRTPTACSRQMESAATEWDGGHHRQGATCHATQRLQSLQTLPSRRQMGHVALGAPLVAIRMNGHWAAHPAIRLVDPMGRHSTRSDAKWPTWHRWKVSRKILADGTCSRWSHRPPTRPPTADDTGPVD
jgi:hypothetical protein